MKKWFAIGIGAIIAILVGLFFWIRPPHAKAPPRGTQATSLPTPDLSTMVAPLQIPFSSLEKTFQDKIPNVFTDEKGKEVKAGLLVDVKAFRKGNVKLSAENHALLLSIPTRVTAKLYRGKRAERLAERKKEEPTGGQVNADLVVRVSLRLSITDDWRLDTQSTVSHRWVSTPTLQAGPFKIKIDELTDKMLSEKWPEVAKKIDAKVEQKDILRAKIEKLWPSLTTPRQLKESPPTWMFSEIEALYVGDPEVQPKELLIQVGFSGRFQILVGDAPTSSTQPTLPPRTQPPEARGVQLALSSLLAWEVLSSLATDKLKSQTFPLPQNSGTLTAETIELYPSGTQMVIAFSYRADLSGWNTEGTLYLLGTPILDEKERSLRLQDISYVLQTWDDAIASANVLAESDIKEELQKRLQFSFGDKLDQAQKQANEGLQKASAERGTFTGELSEISLRGLRITEPGVVIDASIKGQLALRPPDL